MLILQCDFCNQIITNCTIIKYIRSIFQFLHFIPCFIITRGNPRTNRLYATYHLCDACFGRIEELMFRNPNTIEELRQQLNQMRLQTERHNIPQQTGFHPPPPQYPEAEAIPAWGVGNPLRYRINAALDTTEDAPGVNNE